MAKMVYIVHRWYGNHLSDWYPWLKAELESLGSIVIVPDMPSSPKPKIVEWISSLPMLPRNSCQYAYFVGHSLGCQTILRYLELLPKGCMIGGTVLVAPWVSLPNLKGENNVSKEWFEDAINWKAAREHCRKFSVVYSENDPDVNAENADIFAQNLNATKILEKGAGHFTEEDGITELPPVLRELVAMMKPTLKS